MRVLQSFFARPLEADVELAPAPAGPWAVAWAQPEFKVSLLLLSLLYGLVVPVVGPYFHYIQHRPGLLVVDPLLALLPSRNVAQPIFLLMYGAVVAAVGWLLRRPQLLLRGLWGYLILLVLRLCTIGLLPLSPPLALIPMPDPFTAFFFQEPGSELITKDLFFSGHTATVVLLALAVRGRWGRAALFVAAGLVGLLVLVQRVHYSYDVLAAPLFAGLAYWLAGRMVKEITKLPAKQVAALGPLNAASAPLAELHS